MLRGQIDDLVIFIWASAAASLFIDRSAYPLLEEERLEGTDFFFEGGYLVRKIGSKSFTQGSHDPYVLLDGKEILVKR